MKKLKSRSTPPVTEILWPPPESATETARQYVTRVVEKNEAARHTILLAKGWRFLGYSPQAGKAFYANMNIIDSAETFTQLSAFTLQVCYELFTANKDAIEYKTILADRYWWQVFQDYRTRRYSRGSFARALTEYEMEAGVS